MNKYELINKMIMELNRVSVSGMENMKIIIETVQDLGKLFEILKGEDVRDADNQNQQRENV